MSEVYTDCPHCDAEIPFYRTVDELRACPSCGTDSDALFEMAIGAEPIEPADPDPELDLGAAITTDSGHDE